MDLANEILLLLLKQKQKNKEDTQHVDNLALITKQSITNKTCITETKN